MGLAFGDGSSAFLAGVAGAIAGWFAAPAVCAKLGIKPSTPAPAGARHSGLAITGFVFALLGFLLLPGLSFVAVVMGHVAHVKARHAEAKKGLAVAAWVIGYIGIVLAWARHSEAI